MDTTSMLSTLAPFFLRSVDLPTVWEHVWDVYHHINLSTLFVLFLCPTVFPIIRLLIQQDVPNVLKDTLWPITIHVRVNFHNIVLKDHQDCAEDASLVTEFIKDYVLLSFLIVDHGTLEICNAQIVSQDTT